MTPWVRDRTQLQTFAECAERMVAAEQFGYYSSWLTEHHFANDPTYDALGYPAADNPAYDLTPDPLTFLTFVAAKTRTLRLGTGVVVLHYDHPIRVAERAAMLDVLSNGRLELGVGRGSGRIEPAAFHVVQEGNREKFKEALDIIRLAWTGRPFRFDGDYYQFPELAVVPTPIQQPPPIYVAASSTESFGWTGAYGLPYCYVGGAWGPVPRAAYRAQHEQYLAAARTAGHDTTKMLFPHHLLMYCADTDDRAEAVATEYMSRFHAMVEAHYERLRYPEIDQGRFSRLRSADDLGELVRTMIELNLIGSPETCARKLEAYLEVFDLNYLVTAVDFGAMPHNLVLDSMERFARFVMPRFS